MIEAPPGHLILQTLRSHDQWNTVPYSADDRYRGIHHSRRVVLVNPDDLAELGIADRSEVDLVGSWHDGVERRPRLHRRRLPHDAGLRRRVLPGDQRPGPAGQRRRPQQHSHRQGDHDPAGTVTSRMTSHHHPA
jgi:anaerobic selenocysteine-containing dehydrogenase